MKHLLAALVRRQPDGAARPPTASLLSHAWLAPHAAHFALMAACPVASGIPPTPLAADRSFR